MYVLPDSYKEVTTLKEALSRLVNEGSVSSEEVERVLGIRVGRTEEIRELAALMHYTMCGDLVCTWDQESENWEMGERAYWYRRAEGYVKQGYDICWLSDLVRTMSFEVGNLLHKMNIPSEKEVDMACVIFSSVLSASLYPKRSPVDNQEALASEEGESQESSSQRETDSDTPPDPLSSPH